MAADDTAAARRAALLLHSLPPAVRERVLGRLGNDSTERMSTLLDELRAMQVSPALGRRLYDSVDAKQSAKPAATAYEQVASMVAADVAECLSSCSPATAAQLLGAHEWLWQQQVLAAISESRRSAVCRSMRSDATPLSPAVLGALLERLLEEATQLDARARVAASPPADTARTGRSGFGELVRRFTRWIR